MELTVLSGNEEAMDISNKEYVYEVTYGTREAWNVMGTNRWIYGPLEDGTILGVTDAASNQGLYISYSYDNGVTWTTREKIPCTVGKITAMGGFGYDDVAKVLFIIAYIEESYTDSGVRELHIIKSTDQGETWEYVGQVENPNGFNLLTYTDIIQLSTYDGADGTNVDMVVTLSCTESTGTPVYSQVTAYTTDAGATWKLGEPLANPNTVPGHENGLSEGTIMEREDGVLVLLVRNQGEGIDHFAKAYSYDQGKTWTPIEDGDVYTVNTQPIFFDYNGNTMLSWGGNNMYGGTSRLRTPFSLAITYDGGETFVNIQDLYVKYSLQGMSHYTMHRITNQKVVIANDDTFLSCWMDLTDGQSLRTNMLLRVENFHDYYFKTKNAYDSFEHGTVKYEGWDTTAGTTSLAELATSGSFSMKLMDAVVTRSIPYFQDGTISMDIYVDGTATFNLDLQSAYTDVAKKGAPLGIQVVDNVVTFYGATAASGLTLNDGWNTLTFELDLDAETPTATLSLNGGEAKAMPVNAEVGNYICYITPMNTGVLYIDNVLVESDVDALNVYDANHEIPTESIVLDKEEATVEAGKEVTLTATVTPADTTDTIIWTSSDESIATVENGVVIALKSGTVIITATSGNASATCEITVVAGHIPEEDDNDCTTAVHCTICGEVTTEAKAAHTPETDDGDCTTDIKCSVCGKVTTKGNEAHTGGTATCKEKAECSVCGKEYGKLAAHKPEADDGDCTTDIKCSVCSEVTTKGNATHTGGTATCTEKAKCEVCGKAYGDLKEHQDADHDGLCDLCKEDAPATTGDETPLVLLAMIMLLSAVATVLIVTNRKKYF